MQNVNVQKILVAKKKVNDTSDRAFMTTELK